MKWTSTRSYIFPDWCDINALSNEIVVMARIFVFTSTFYVNVDKVRFC